MRCPLSGGNVCHLSGRRFVALFVDLGVGFDPLLGADLRCHFDIDPVALTLGPLLASPEAPVVRLQDRKGLERLDDPRRRSLGDRAPARNGPYRWPGVAAVRIRVIGVLQEHHLRLERDRKLEYQAHQLRTLGAAPTLNAGSRRWRWDTRGEKHNNAMELPVVPPRAKSLKLREAGRPPLGTTFNK